VWYSIYISNTNNSTEKEGLMRKAVVMGTDESVTVVDLDGPDGTLKVLQTAVDGWVQVVDLTSTMSIWVNEEGKMNGLPYNKIATDIFQRRFGAVDVMVGNAVLTGGTDSEGETLGLTDEQVAVIIGVYA
jgi:hypothetical protein